MPNLVNQIVYEDLRREFESMGSCLVIAFDKLQPQQDIALRTSFRNAGIKYRVVKNRLAVKAFADLRLDLKKALVGKCGIALAAEEGAIKAAKLVREYIQAQKQPPVEIVGGVVEGTAYVGADAATIADLPDRQTIRTQLAIAVSGPARSLASVVNAVAGGMARCIQAKIDKQAQIDQAGESGAAAAG